MLSASEQVLPHSYSYNLVALSFLIATVASYAAFNLGERIAIYHDRKRFAWLAGGASAMGIGIWSMHYTGMLAFKLPVAIAYHVPTVALSLVVAVSGSAAALTIVSRDLLSRRSLLFGSLAMGGAIGAMHYIGMAAMRGPMMCHFSPGRVVLSLVVAVALSGLALWLMFYFRQTDIPSGWLKVIAAFVMGSGIACMHYTAMSAASFTPANTSPGTSWSVGVSGLAVVGIVAATMLVLLGALLTSWLDRRLALERISQQVLETVNIVLWRAEPRTLRLDFVSSSAARVLGDGINVHQCGPLWIDRIHPDDVERVRSHYETAARTKKPSQFDYRFIKADGRTIWLREVVLAISERGRTCLMGTTRDVSDSKLLEQALMAEEKLAALGRLSAAIAHEINNPLQAALNLIYIVGAETSDPQSHDFLTKAEQELRRAAEIARITLGFYKGGDSYSQVDFGRISSDLAFLYESRMQDKRVSFSADISESAVLLGSEGEVRQILSNLMSNALDACHEHGTICLRISPSQDWRNGGRPGVRMTVFDNGTGFNSKALDQAFLPFFTTKKEAGTGLGLWVVRQLAEKYQGHITIRSSQAASRHGTAVSIFLPSAAPVIRIDAGERGLADPVRREPYAKRA
jgi:NO-binding membrane sensor protein with MHYT domain/nitrogen-specific signal transduction histidine kinase